MNITIYRNTGDMRQLNKNLTVIANITTAQLSDTCSITDPELLIDYNDNYVNANYFYIEKWARYYYVTERTIINGNQIVIRGHVDVLASFRSAILNSECIANRSSSNTNAYIEDPICGSAGSIQTFYRKSGATPFGYTGNNYVLTIAGK